MTSALVTPRPHRRRIDGPIVVGAGLAGLSAALAAAPRPTLVISPVPLGAGCASAWAQGGMAAALSPGDDPALHAADTLAAAAGLGEAAAVEILTREGPDAVRRLAALGAPFDRTADGGFAQSLEAAHSRPRVARVGGDGAGAAIMAAVAAAARAAPHVEILEGAHVLALLQDGAGCVCGVLARRGEALVEILGAGVILATGGLGGLFAVTTDPAEVRGEGLALAALAGATVMDAEFVQFHPTAIAVDADPAPLATEALRGEGAWLVDAEGRRFMPAVHPAAELAPRDIVARAIAAQLDSGAGAFLDARAVPDLAHEFPAVVAACRAGGIDPLAAPIPVRPAVHYHMGGIETDLTGAVLGVPGLFAAGECAAVGVHGANRLASNSLLEAAVFGTRAGAAAAALAAPPAGGPERLVPSPAPPPQLSGSAFARLRLAMSAGAGVVRDAAGLTRLLAQIDALEDEAGPALPLLAARLVARAALDRHESRGAHCRTDHPATDAIGRHSRYRLAGAQPVLAGDIAPAPSAEPALNEWQELAPGLAPSAAPDLAFARSAA